MGPFTLAEVGSISSLSPSKVHVERVRQCRYLLAEKNGSAVHRVGTYIPEVGPCEFYDSDDIAVRIWRMGYFPDMGAFGGIPLQEGDIAPYNGADRPFSGIQKKGGAGGLDHAQNPSSELRTR